VHVLDYRAFTRYWKVDHKRSVKGGPNAVLLLYSVNEGPCAGQVGLALVAAADIRPGGAWAWQLRGRWLGGRVNDALHALREKTMLHLMILPKLMYCKATLGVSDLSCRMLRSSYTMPYNPR
jgi:hypothetical protein